MQIDPAASPMTIATNSPDRLDQARTDNTMHNLLGMLTSGSGDQDSDGDGVDDLDLNRDGTVSVDEFMMASQNGVSHLADMLDQLHTAEEAPQQDRPAHQLRKALESYARNME